jgi:hypothetical protein
MLLIGGTGAEGEGGRTNRLVDHGSVFDDEKGRPMCANVAIAANGSGDMLELERLLVG